MSELLLLINAEVFAPQPRGIQQLLVAGGKIVWLGKTRPEVPRGTPVSDMQGRRLVPGFIDGHVHLTGGGGESGFASRVPAPTISQYTLAGVTSVVGVLGTDDITRHTRDLVAQALALREQGLSAWCHTGGYHLPPVTLTGKVCDDLVYIDPIIGLGEVAISDHRSSQPTLDELLRLASDVHVGGLVTGKAGILHLHLGDGGRGLALVRDALAGSELPARVFNPTHVNRKRALFDEAIALARSGCVVDLTAFPVAGDEDAWPADEALARYLESGAPASNITVSSDGGGCLPVFDEQGQMLSMDVGHSGALLEMLRAAVARGLSLETVLPSLTVNPATLLRLPGKGVLQTGSDADLVCLDDQYRITDVMAGGQWHVREGTLLRPGRFEKC